MERSRTRPAEGKGSPAGRDFGNTGPAIHPIALPCNRRIGSILFPNGKGEFVTTNEVAVVNYRYDAEALRHIESFDDAMALVESTYGEIMTADSELGDGFSLLKEKDVLIGVPCLFLSWSFSEGDFSEEFVSCRLVTKDGAKYVLNDGGTGIRAQLRAFSDSHGGRMGGLLSRRGLRKSEYEFENDKGKMEKGTTYYVDTGA